MTGETLEAIYSPETGRVACVLIQAAFRCDQRVANLFCSEDWDVAPNDQMVRILAPMAVWWKIAGMSRQERVASFRAEQSADAGGESCGNRYVSHSPVVEVQGGGEREGGS